MRVVVVGSGIAGLIAAHRSSARHEVVLVTKGELAESNTALAQGGIAAALFPDDSVESHIADTLRAGAGLGDPDAVRVLCSEGPERVRALIKLGVEFDRDAAGELARGHEAAHSFRRVVHAGGDATGAAIEHTLVQTVRQGRIELREHTFLVDIVVRAGAVTGVDVIGPEGERRIEADAVILATGGIGQLYRHTTNPASATGDGLAAAWRAGAELADMEFVQFHPTALAVEGSPLISEAVRGEGAVLLDEQGHRFMLDVHPDAELAPRDVVARGIARAMAAQSGRPVHLDATGLERTHGEGYLATRFPTVSSQTRAHGCDWRREPIPVTPAAHYAMGGVRTDLDGRTNIPGLFAVGEVACTGVHGANRLASNSLLEGLVFAWRAAEALDAPCSAPGGRPARIRDCERVPRHSANEGATPTRHAIRALMWDAVGLERTADTLRAALDTLSQWSVPGGTIAARETQNLLEIARIVTVASLAREESRGAHYRDDHPHTRESERRSLVWHTHINAVPEGIPA